MIRRWCCLLISGLALAMAGCSTAPIAGAMDFFTPSAVRYKSNPAPRPNDDLFAPREFDRDLDRGRPLPLPSEPPGSRPLPSDLPRLGEPLRPNEEDVPFRRERSAPLGRSGTNQQNEILPLPNNGFGR